MVHAGVVLRDQYDSRGRGGMDELTGLAGGRDVLGLPGGKRTLPSKEGSDACDGAGNKNRGDGGEAPRSRAHGHDLAPRGRGTSL